MLNCGFLFIFVCHQIGLHEDSYLSMSYSYSQDRAQSESMRTQKRILFHGYTLD